MLQLIVGLGNPGARYKETRHNAGRWFVERLAEEYKLTFNAEAKFHSNVVKLKTADGECWLLLPTTYMNQSGQAVSHFLRYYSIAIEDTLVAHDEIDLPPGSIKFKQGGGHAGHNGLRHIIQCLGGQNAFQRLRIGIGRGILREDVVDYVLSPPSKEEHIAISHALDKAVALIPELLSGAWQQVMNELHRL